MNRFGNQGEGPLEPHRGDETPHLPGPSLWPIGFAVGIACLLLGIVVSWVVAAIGAALVVVFGYLWVREATAEYRGHVAVEPEIAAPRERAEPGTPALPAHVGPAAMPELEPGERFPRSKFLELSTLGVGGVIGGIVTVPALGFMVLPAFLDQGRKDVDLGPLENFPEGQFVVVTFLEKPESGEVSRRTAFVRNNGLAGTEPKKPSFTIVSNRCVHLGCPVQPSGPLLEDERKEYKRTQKIKQGEVEREEQIVVSLIPTQPAGFGCPCHGGAYDTEGNRTAGPPVRSLDRYEFSVREGHLFLGEPFSVGTVEGTGADARIRRFALHGPGEHVGDWESLLYPIPSPPH